MKKLKMPRKLKFEIISALDADASKAKVIGLHQSNFKKWSNVARDKKLADGPGFIRSGKYALGRLTRHQHEIMNHMRSEWRAGNLS